MQDVKVFSARRSQLAECPLWEPREQALYWIDIQGKAVHRRRLDGSAQDSWSLPTEPGCIARAENGLVVAMRSGIVLLDTGSGKISPLAAAPYDTSKQRFNDGRCDAKGRLWVGTIHEPRDGPHARLYCFENGRLRDAGLGVTVSNGLAFSPDGQTMYHADTTAHEVRAYAFDAQTGSLGAGRSFQQFDTHRGPGYGGRPDGAAIDSEGNYWVAMYEGACLLCFSPSGERLAQHMLPARCPTMPAFGGEDLRTLFVTSVSHGRTAEELATYPQTGHVFSMPAPVQGRVEPLCLL